MSFYQQCSNIVKIRPIFFISIFFFVGQIFFAGFTCAQGNETSTQGLETGFEKNVSVRSDNTLKNMTLPLSSGAEMIELLCYRCRLKKVNAGKCGRFKVYWGKIEGIDTCPSVASGQ